MSQSQRVARMVAAIFVLSALVAAIPAMTTAQTVNPSVYPKSFTYDVNECYFASVSNGEDFGLGASQTSLTIQNLSDEPGVVYLKAGKNGTFVNGQFAALKPGASKTFSAASLGIAAGSTAAVAVAGYDWDSSQAGKFTDNDGIAIGCVAKQAVAGANLPSTTAADSSVSGFNATAGREVGYTDALYLPIVQTNCGPGGCWDTVVRVANVGPFDNAAVTLRFFQADNGQGSLDTGFQLQKYLNQGEVWSLNVSDHVPAGWVGSVHVVSDDHVVAIADRFKAGTDMWITNTASNAVAESGLQLPSGPSNMPYVLYAPDVRLDYNGWNTGISVANTVNVDNTVNIQYFGSDGNAPQAQTQRLSAHGMTYFYNPSSPAEDACAQPVNQVVTCDFVGGAIVLSQDPVAVVIDGVKYAGNDANVGQAFSYSATGNVFQFQAAPLVQKGMPSTGMGATSGITFLNTNPTGTFVSARWINPSGFDASNAGDSVVWVPAFATGFIYTMTQHNIPNGFVGSAYLHSDLPLAATSANVDYAVSGDGTAIWNLYNPCGLFRQVGQCSFDPPAPAPATKTFDIRPLSANPWICVYPAVSGQGDKPTAPAGDCLPEQVYVKGQPDGGQDNIEYYVLRDDNQWCDGPWRFYSPDEFSRQLQQDSPAAMTCPPDHPGFAWAPVTITYNPATDVWDFQGLPNDFFVYIHNWMKAAPSGDGYIPANIQTSCREVDAEMPDGYTMGYWGPIPHHGTYGTANRAMMGDLSKAVVELWTSGTRYCAPLEPGTLRQETATEMQERLQTIVPPVQADAQGFASIDLPAGCYFFLVSDENSATHRSVEECLTAGEALNNPVDLVTPAPVGSLTKYFCGEVDRTNPDAPVCINPATSTVVTLRNAEFQILNVRSTDYLTGRVFYDELPHGLYNLCWIDYTSNGNEDSPGPYLPSCEQIIVTGAEVVYNQLDPFPHLDLCIVDQFGDPLANVSGLAIGPGEQYYWAQNGMTRGTGRLTFRTNVEGEYTFALLLMGTNGYVYTGTYNYTAAHFGDDLCQGASHGDFTAVITVDYGDNGR